MTAPFPTGAGAFDAGIGPAGHDPEDAIVLRANEAPPAIEFDPYDRVFAQNDDLTMVASTGPIQRASLLMMPLGAIAATPTSGIDIAAIRKASPAARITVITDALNRAWKTLIETNQIAIGKVTVPNPASPWDGVWEVEVTDLVNKKTASLEQPTKLTGRV